MASSRPLFSDDSALSPASTALALKLVTRTDLLRLKAIARLHARSLPPDVGWEDILQESLTRVITGTRAIPEGVPAVAFLAGVMRSVRSQHWRRVQTGSHAGDALALPDPAPDPERAVAAQQELRAIRTLFREDRTATRIIDGLAQGSSPGEICAAHRISRTDYDSARRRMRRTLLREGLTCEPR